MCSALAAGQVEQARNRSKARRASSRGLLSPEKIKSFWFPAMSKYQKRLFKFKYCHKGNIIFFKRGSFLNRVKIGFHLFFFENKAARDYFLKIKGIHLFFWNHSEH